MSDPEIKFIDLTMVRFDVIRRLAAMFLAAFFGKVPPGSKHIPNNTPTHVYLAGWFTLLTYVGCPTLVVLWSGPAYLLLFVSVTVGLHMVVGTKKYLGLGSIVLVEVAEAAIGLMMGIPLYYAYTLIFG